MWTYRSVPKIVFGEDALEDIETLQGRKAIIISDRVLNRLNFVEKVEERLIDFDTALILNLIGSSP
jgi:alcohol dehydrogenase class IV